MSTSFVNPGPCSSFQFASELRRELEPLSSPAEAAKGEAIITQGEPCRGLYIVQSGLVRISILSGAKEVFSRILGPGGVVGLPATLCSQPYSFTGTCLEPARLAFIESHKVMEFLRTRPLLCMEVVKLMSQELAEMNQARTNLQACRDCGCAFVDACEHHMQKK